VFADVVLFELLCFQFVLLGLLLQLVCIFLLEHLNPVFTSGLVLLSLFL
jgi:hypothetical protein